MKNITNGIPFQTKKKRQPIGTASVYRQVFTATENQTVFTLSTTYETNDNRITVFVGGVKQFSPNNFTETSSNSFTLSEGVPINTEVIVEILK